MSDEPPRTLPANPTRASIRSDRVASAAQPAQRSVRRATDWRSGDRPSENASIRALTAALVAGGLGVLSAAAVEAFPNGTSGLVSTAVLWTGMLAAVAYSFVVQPAPGLFQVRFSDIVWGIGGAALLRIVVGLTSGADVVPFPTANGVTVSLSSWILHEALPAGLVGPVVEELFFRAVPLIALYRLLCPRVGLVMAGAVSALLSAGTFVLLHAAFAPLEVSDSLQLLAVGLVCALLVLLTGRIWGALLLHVTYNVSFLVLGIVGVMLT